MPLDTPKDVATLNPMVMSFQKTPKDDYIGQSHPTQRDMEDIADEYDY